MENNVEEDMEKGLTYFLRVLAVSVNRGCPIWTPTLYNPHYEGPQGR